MLVKYWADESVKVACYLISHDFYDLKVYEKCNDFLFFLQELADHNKEHRTSLTDPHTLGANSGAQIGEKLVCVCPC